MERLLAAIAIIYVLPILLGLAARALRALVDRLGDLETRYRRKPAQIAR